MTVDSQLQDQLNIIADPKHKRPDQGEHLCFIWCDGKVDVVRLESRKKAHTWHTAHAAIWHLVDKSRNAGTLMLPANEKWHDVVGRDGIPGYVALYVKSYLTGRVPDRQYRDRCFGITEADRFKAATIWRELRDERDAIARASLRAAWPTMTAAARASKVASVHWATPEEQQLAADACSASDPEVIIALTPGMDAVDDCGWSLRRGDVTVRLYEVTLSEYTGQPMAVLVNKRELRWRTDEVCPVTPRVCT